MLKVNPINCFRFIALNSKFSGIDISASANFYKERELYEIKLFGRVLGVFCINNGPIFRSTQMLDPKQYEHQIKILNRESLEVAGFAINKVYRSGLISLFCWYAIYTIIKKRPEKFLIAATHEPRLCKLYQSGGLKPVFNATTADLNLPRTSWYFKLERTTLSAVLIKFASSRFRKSMGLQSANASVMVPEEQKNTDSVAS